jgi:hypothetical protein
MRSGVPLARRKRVCLLDVDRTRGLVRGEALLLPANAVKSGIDERTLSTRHWMNVANLFEDEETRTCDQPSIKNAQSVRQIPVSPLVAERFQHFVSIRGRSWHPMLFLNNSGRIPAP